MRKTTMRPLHRAGEDGTARGTRASSRRSKSRFLQTTLAICLLMGAMALTANASVIITNSAGMTTKTFNSSGSDGAGDSISVIGGIFFNSVSDGEVVASSGGTPSVTFTFAAPLASFGFDMGQFGPASITSVTLSNADSLTTSLPFAVSAGNFYGISSTTNFSSATVTFSMPASADIKDFRLGSAVGTPEPETLALVAPVLLAGLLLRLRKRAVR